jgi:hypothetical protein
MVATPTPAIASPVRYSKTQDSWVYVLPTCADITAPTRAELIAGTRIDKVIPKDGVAGFSGTESTITTDDLASGITIPLHDGEDWSAGSTITAYADKGYTATGGVDIRSVLAKDSDVVVVLFDSDDTPGKTCDLFKVHVGAHTKSRSGAATIDIACTFTDVPAQNVAVPTNP